LELREGAPGGKKSRSKKQSDRGGEIDGSEIHWLAEVSLAHDRCEEGPRNNPNHGNRHDDQDGAKQSGHLALPPNNGYKAESRQSSKKEEDLRKHSGPIFISSRPKASLNGNRF
jgi:hypothetical protein